VSTVERAQRRGRSGVSPERLRLWVEASCAAQGVPVKVSDPRVLANVAALLAPAAGGSATARQRGRSRPAAASGAPDRLHPGQVQRTGPGSTGSDDGVVEHGRDDRGLPGEGQVVPELP